MAAFVEDLGQWKQHCLKLKMQPSYTRIKSRQKHNQTILKIKPHQLQTPMERHSQGLLFIIVIFLIIIVLPWSTLWLTWHLEVSPYSING